MEGADLDYNSQEEEEKGYPKVLLWLLRVAIVVVVIIVGFIMMNLVTSVISLIKQANYKPTVAVLDSPQTPYTVYEMSGEMEINIIGKEDEGNLKVVLPKVVLAYNKDNLKLSQVLSNKGSRLGRIVRESISSKSIKDLSNTQLRESVVKGSILRDINNYLMGRETPVEGSKSDKVSKKGDELRLLEIVRKNKAEDISQDYFKVINLENNTEGWIPAKKVDIDSSPLKVKEDYHLLNGEKTGGVGKLSSGIIDVYFPKGLRVMPIKNRY